MNYPRHFFNLRHPARFWIAAVLGPLIPGLLLFDRMEANPWLVAIPVLVGALATILSEFCPPHIQAPRSNQAGAASDDAEGYTTR